MIKVKCDVKDTLELDELSDFQGNLKERGDADFEKIQKSIRKRGFSFPFFVWKKEKANWVLDGHGRLGAFLGASPPKKKRAFTAWRRINDCI